MIENYFFALWPDEATAKKLYQIGQLILPDNQQRLIDWTRLHITLVYLGKVEPELLERAKQIAGQIQAAPFRLKVDQAKQWRRAKLLWLGEQTENVPLQRLFAELQLKLATLGFKPEARQFKPHISIARKYNRPQLSVQFEAVEWWVDRFYLVKSINLGNHSVYETIGSWPLKNKLSA